MRTMRTIAALTIAVATWIGVQTFTAPTTTAGICQDYSNGWTVCVPAASPSGAGMQQMWEDGSAVYVDGYVFDGYSEA
jgi:hypothetical protein